MWMVGLHPEKWGTVSYWRLDPRAFGESTVRSALVPVRWHRFLLSQWDDHTHPPACGPPFLGPSLHTPCPPAPPSERIHPGWTNHCNGDGSQLSSRLLYPTPPPLVHRPLKIKLSAVVLLLLAHSVPFLLRLPHFRKWCHGPPSQSIQEPLSYIQSPVSSSFFFWSF